MSLVLQATISETRGHILCSRVNYNGDNEVRPMSDCELLNFDHRLQTSQSYLLAPLDPTIAKNDTEIDNIFGYVVTAEEPCSTYDYHAYFVKCVVGTYYALTLLPLLLKFIPRQKPKQVCSKAQGNIYIG